MHPESVRTPAPPVLDPGAELDTVLHQIGELDAVLAHSENLLEMEKQILCRAALLERLAVHLAAIQAQRREPNLRQVNALQQAGMASLELLRRAVFTKHQVATEMMHLQQEQRLTGFMGLVAEPQRRLNLEA